MVIVSQYGSLCYILEININIIFQMALVVKNLPAKEENSRDAGSIPWLARSPGVENAQDFSCHSKYYRLKGLILTKNLLGAVN